MTSRLIPLTFDEGNLAVFDPAPVSVRIEEDFIENCTKSMAELFERLLRQENSDSLGSLSIKNLPEPLIRLPRSLPIPKPKPLTKWQEFAKKKGIHKPKQGALKFDETRNEWAAAHGKRSAKNKTKLESSWIKDWKEGDEFND
jgi:regulator of ribosome biosynthesis